MSAPALTSYANGISQVSGDNLNTFSSWCVTFAQLRGFTPNPAVPNLLVYAEGNSAPGDGGQGFFFWNPVQGTDDGGVTTIVPNGSTAACWSRIPAAVLTYTPQTVSSATGVTLTAANVANQVLVVSGGAGLTDTFPSASAITALFSGLPYGAVIDLLVINANTGTLLLAPGAGVTFAGNLSTGNFSIATLTQRLLKIYYSSASAVTVYG